MKIGKLIKSDYVYIIYKIKSAKNEKLISVELWNSITDDYRSIHMIQTWVYKHEVYAKLFVNFSL